jgi:hypothetical protein
MAQTIKTVDFLPQKDILGDVKKISEFDVAHQNAKIIPVITLLCMEQGSNQIFPEMGVRESLVSIPYKELKDVYGVLEGIAGHLERYSGSTVRVYIDEDDPRTNLDKGELSISIEVEGVSTPIKVDLTRSNKRSFKVRHPSIFSGGN